MSENDGEDTAFQYRGESYNRYIGNSLQNQRLPAKHGMSLSHSYSLHYASLSYLSGAEWGPFVNWCRWRGRQTAKATAISSTSYLRVFQPGTPKTWV